MISDEVLKALIVGVPAIIAACSSLLNGRGILRTNKTLNGGAAVESQSIEHSLLTTSDNICLLNGMKLSPRERAVMAKILARARAAKKAKARQGKSKRGRK